MAFTEMLRNDKDTNQLPTLIRSKEGPDMIASFYPEGKMPIFIFL